MTTWSGRRWGVATITALVTVVVVGVPTVLIPNPWFGRQVEPTWWAWPVLVVTAVLSGLVTATYVRAAELPSPAATVASSSDQSRRSLVGGFLAYLAVGCPVCNKIALLALGSAGAIRWFAPVQPFLAVAGIALLGYALHRRLAGEKACPLPAARRSADVHG